MDAQTFRDLEIFESEDGQASLFSLLDRARTRGGAAALRRRFEEPLGDVEAIRAVQASIRFILEHRPTFKRMPGQYVLSAFDNYFHWRLAPPVSGNVVGATVDAVQLLLENYPQYTQIARGVRQTIRMLAALAAIATDPALADAPGDLGVFLLGVRQILESPALRRIPLAGEERWRVVRLLAVDRVLRGSEKEALHQLRQLLFEIDALVSMARATSEYGFTLPEAVEGAPHVSARGLVHPLIADAVPNVLQLEPAHRLLFLTGPNMAGKTTYVRACGIAVYLAHVGMGVPAESFRFAPCDALFTSIRTTDSVRGGISYFEAEALRARTIADAVAAGLRILAIMDEPFKGTNVKDAVDASRAFLERLAAFAGSLFLVSSHLIEVAEPLNATGAVACWHFEAQQTGEHLAFDYTVRPGVSGQRLGMRVLEEKGVLQVLDTALAARVSAADACPPAETAQPRTSLPGLH